MEETRINIAEILKNYAEGTKLYSPLCGDVILLSVHYTIAVKSEIGDILFFNKYGIYNTNYANAECLLFPSKDQRDWSKFNVNKPKFDPKVLVRDKYDKTWVYDIYSYKNDNGFICSVGVQWDYCIPYNEETKHLLGTNEEAPEFYRYWEE